MLNIKFKSKSRWIKPEYFMQNKAIEYLLFSEGIKYTRNRSKFGMGTRF